MSARFNVSVRVSGIRTSPRTFQAEACVAHAPGTERRLYLRRGGPTCAGGSGRTPAEAGAKALRHVSMLIDGQVAFARGSRNRGA
jgi:hypothetical protein